MGVHNQQHPQHQIAESTFSNSLKLKDCFLCLNPVVRHTVRGWWSSTGKISRGGIQIGAPASFTRFSSTFRLYICLGRREPFEATKGRGRTEDDPQLHQTLPPPTRTTRTRNETSVDRSFVCLHSTFTERRFRIEQISVVSRRFIS